MNPKPKMVDDRTVLTGLFTLSFPQIAKPGEKYNKYSIRALIEKGSETETALKDAARNAMNESGMDVEVTKVCIFDGDGPKAAKFKGHDGMWYINPSCGGDRERPPCYKGPVLIDDEREIAKTFYAGARCRAEVYAHTYDGGVTFLLNAIQFCEDGERLGGRTSSGSEFDDEYSSRFAENEEPAYPFEPFENDDDIGF